MTALPLDLAELTTTAAPVPCDAHGCTRTAAVALRFDGQAGHVHDCNPCAAELREFCDVAESHPLPCPWPHGDGFTWVDQPKELR